MRIWPALAAAVVLCAVSRWATGRVSDPSVLLRRQATADLPLAMVLTAHPRRRQQRLQHQQHAARRSNLVLQGVRICADQLKQTGLARLPGAASELADCSSMLAAKVARWRSSDECLECKSSGSDCDKCAQVAKGEAKGTYTGGVSPEGSYDDDDIDFSDDDIKDMENFFKNDPIFSDPGFRDEFFKHVGEDLDRDFDDDLIFPPGVGQPPWMGTGSDDLPLPPLPPMTPEEEAEFKKFDKEMAAAVAALEVEDARSRRGRGSHEAEASLPVSLARTRLRTVETEGALHLRPQDWLGGR